MPKSLRIPNMLYKYVFIFYWAWVVIDLQAFFDFEFWFRMNWKTYPWHMLPPGDRHWKLICAYKTAHFNFLIDYRCRHWKSVTIYIANEVGGQSKLLFSMSKHVILEYCRKVKTLNYFYNGNIKNPVYLFRAALFKLFCILWRCAVPF